MLTSCSAALPSVLFHDLMCVRMDRLKLCVTACTHIRPETNSKQTNRKTCLKLYWQHALCCSMLLHNLLLLAVGAHASSIMLQLICSLHCTTQTQSTVCTAGIEKDSKQQQMATSSAGSCAALPLKNARQFSEHSETYKLQV